MRKQTKHFPKNSMSLFQHHFWHVPMKWHVRRAINNIKSLSITLFGRSENCSNYSVFCAFRPICKMREIWRQFSNKISVSGHSVIYPPPAPPHIHLFLVIYMPRCMQEGPSYISLDTLIWNQIPAVSQIECQIPPLFKSPCANAASLSERLIPCRRPCLRVSCVYPIRKKLKQLAQFQWKLRIQYFCCVS